jgi:hypothetical protein
MNSEKKMLRLYVEDGASSKNRRPVLIEQDAASFLRNKELAKNRDLHVIFWVEKPV